MTPLNNTLLYIFTALFFLCSTPQNSVAEETATFCKSFGDWLFERGDKEEAEREYLKYIFLTHDVEKSVLFRLSRMYLEQEEPKKVLQLLDSYYYPKQGEVPGDALDKENQQIDFLYGFSLLKIGTKETNMKFEVLSNSFSLNNKERGSIQDLRVYYDIQNKNYSGALEKFSVDEEDSLFLLRRSLQEDLSEYTYKSPITASLLSSVIPGLGRVYSKQYADAVFSFLSVGALFAITGYTISTEDLTSWKPWAYGASSVIFYTANIYGSWVAADRYNKASERKIEQTIDEILIQYVP